MPTTGTTLQSLVTKIATQILNPIITLLFLIATIVFVWGIVLYVLGGKGDASKVDAAKKVIFWGIIGMFIMASAWGIVNLLCDFFETCGAVTTPASSGGEFFQDFDYQEGL